MSKCARTKAVIRETGELGGDSCGDFGFDGNLPRRPFKESVLTTWTKTKSNLSIPSRDPSFHSLHLILRFSLSFPFPFSLFPERTRISFGKTSIQFSNSLLSPFRPSSTSGSDKIGNDSAGVCQRGKLSRPGTRISSPFARSS